MNKKYIVGIGAANVDIYAKSLISIKTHYDHPAKIHTSVGGVTRNVLENLAKLNVNTILLSAIGNDIYGQMIIEHCKKKKIDVNHVLKVNNQTSGLFVQIQDKNNDMYLANCDMSVISHIDIKYIKRNDSILKNSSGIIIDPSLDSKVIEYILKTYKSIPLFLDPVSDNYAKKVKPYISKLYACKPNKTELEILSGIKINNQESLIKAGKKLIQSGLKKLYASLGSKGCLYMDNEGVIIYRKINPLKNIVNASGAGDAFFASIIYSYISGCDRQTSLDYAIKASKLTLMSKDPISDKLSVSYLKNEKENI